MIIPSFRITKPEPRPAPTRSPLCPPNSASNGSAATRSTVSVCTVTTEGATRATASTIAVRRDVFAWALACAAVAGGRATVCASPDAGDAP
jgi:hypothetical protein